MDKNIKITVVKDEREIEMLNGRQSFKYTYDDVTMGSLRQHYLLKDSLYLLAKDGEKFVAFCTIDRGWWEDNYFFIREILVDPIYQNLGLGKKLMQRCIAHAQQKGARGVVTETAYDNLPMQNLCERLGFEKWNNPQWQDGVTYKLYFPLNKD